MRAVLNADDARAEVLDLCQSLIRVDTTNPPGRETAAAVVLRDHLEAAGVSCELVARDPDRANLVARIPGVRRRPVAGLRRAPGRRARRPARLDPSALRGRRRRRLPLRPRRRGHEERAGRARGRDGPAGAGRLHPAGRPVAAGGRRRGGRLGGRRHALAARAPPRHPAGLRAERGRRAAPGAAGRSRRDGHRGRRQGHLPRAGHRHRRGGARLDAAQGRNAVPLLAELLRRVGTGLPDPRPSPVVDRMVAVLTGDAVPTDADGYRSALAAAAGMHPRSSTSSRRSPASRWRRRCSPGRASAT